MTMVEVPFMLRKICSHRHRAAENQLLQDASQVTLVTQVAMNRASELLRDNKAMPWYTWVFSGAGAAAILPIIGWVVARLHRQAVLVPEQQEGTALPSVAVGLPAAAAPAASAPADNSTGRQGMTEQVPGQRPLIDYLVGIPEMRDPIFRQLVYASLPAPVAQQLHVGDRERIELLSLIDTFSHYPNLRPWQALQDRITELLPGNITVEQLGAELARLGLTHR